MAGKAIDLLSPACVEIIVETIRAAEAHYGCPVGLIIIDTFNKGVAMGGGDENAAKDQNITAANLQQVQDQTDVHIALIGHTGKDESRGARGSNAHLGDVDMMVQISVAEGVRTAAITKINDGVEGVLTRFRVVPVTLGSDEDGDPITTAIVSDEVPEQGRAGLNKTQQRAMELLEAALSEDGEPAPDNGQVSERRHGGAGGAMAGPLFQGRVVPGRDQGQRQAGVQPRRERADRPAPDRRLGRAGLDRPPVTRLQINFRLLQPGQSPFVRGIPIFVPTLFRVRTNRTKSADKQNSTISAV